MYKSPCSGVLVDYNNLPLVIYHSCIEPDEEVEHISPDVLPVMDGFHLMDVIGIRSSSRNLGSERAYECLREKELYIWI